VSTSCNPRAPLSAPASKSDQHTYINIIFRLGSEHTLIWDIWL
jgi:hypothetical protein